MCTAVADADARRSSYGLRRGSARQQRQRRRAAACCAPKSRGARHGGASPAREAAAGATPGRGDGGTGMQGVSIKPAARQARARPLHDAAARPPRALPHKPKALSRGATPCRAPSGSAATPACTARTPACARTVSAPGDARASAQQPFPQAPALTVGQTQRAQGAGRTKAPRCRTMTTTTMSQISGISHGTVCAAIWEVKRASVWRPRGPRAKGCCWRRRQPP